MCIQDTDVAHLLTIERNLIITLTFIILMFFRRWKRSKMKKELEQKIFSEETHYSIKGLEPQQQNLQNLK